MAIAIDASTSDATFSGTGPYTLNFQCGGTQRLLVVVAVGIRNSTSAWTWSSGSYNSVALTEAAANGSSGNSRNTQVAVWTLVNPAAGGSYQVSMTPSTGLLAGALAVMSFTGVDQSTPLGNTGTDTGQKADYSASITTGAASAWLVGGAGLRNGNLSWTAGSGVTEVVDASTGSSATDDVVVFGGYRSCGAAGSYAFAASSSAGTPYGALAAVEVRAAAAASGIVPILVSHFRRMNEG